MSDHPQHEQETLRRIELLIARVLFWGALLAITVAAVGLVMYVAKDGLGSISLQQQLQHQTKDQKLVFVSVSAIARSLKNGDPLAITASGLLLLLLIPFTMIAILIVAFFKEHDYRYSTIAGIVFAILMISIVIGGG